MRNIRSAVDAVLVGAGTARAEEMDLGVPGRLSEKRVRKGLSEQPLGIVLAGSGELPLHRKLFRSQRQRVLVIVGDSTPGSTLEEASRLGVGVLRAEGAGLPRPEEVLGLLKERLDVGTALLEGGPGVNAAFLAAEAVDELFLTLSPRISRSREDAPTLAAPAANPATTDFDLASVHSSSPEDGELYLRYRRR